MSTIKKPKLPRKIKKAAFSDKWNYIREDLFDLKQTYYENY